MKEGRQRVMEGSPFSGTLIAHNSGDPLKGSEAQGEGGQGDEVHARFLLRSEMV